MSAGKHQDDLAWVPQGERILVEIPAERMPRSKLRGGLTWRTASDMVFKQLLAGNGGNYALVGIVRDSDSDRVYLIAEKVSGLI